MKRMLCICLTLLCLASCNKTKNLFTLTAHIEGLEDSLALAILPDTAYARIDTIRITDGSFVYTLTTDTVTQVTLFFPTGRQFTLFAEQGIESRLSGSAEAWEELDIRGGTANNELREFRQTNLHTHADDLGDSLRSFISRHPFSPAGAYLVDKYFVQQPDPDAKAVQAFIKQMAGTLHDYRLVKDMQQYLDDKQKLDSGQYISPLRIRDTKGDYLNFTKYNNRYQILTFWASWHPASRQRMKAVTRAAKDYKKEKVAFINVSIDTDRQCWKDAIEQDTLSEGDHCSDLEGWDGRAAKQFAVSRIPLHVLLGKQRRLIMQSQSLDSLLNKLDEYLQADKKKEKKN